jgi:hypothetical protein
MSYKPTATVDYVKKPQFTEEVTEGTLPLGSAPTPTQFKHMGYVQEISKPVVITNEQFRILGSYDVGSQIKLGEEYAFSITYRPVDTRLMKYGISLPNAAVAPDHTMTTPNGTNAVSISILVSRLLDGVEKYRTYVGCKTASINVSVTRDAGCVVTQNFRCRDITDWAVAPTFVGVVVYATAASGDPWSGITSGADPMTLNGTPKDTNSFVFNVDCGLADYKPNGQLSIKYLKSNQRAITWESNTPLKDAVIEGFWRAYTSLTIVYTVAPAITFTFAVAKIDTYDQNDSAGSIDFSIEEISGTAQTVTVAG